MKQLCDSPQFSTCFNDRIKVLAAPTDPKWRDEIEKARAQDAKNRADFNFVLARQDGDSNLCAVQCRQEARGLEMAEAVRTIYGFRARTVHAGGSSFGPRFETRDELQEWLLKEWWAAAPHRREVIDRGMAS